MDSTYSGSYGRVKVYQTDFLSESFIESLFGMKDLEEVTRALSSTSYREDIDALFPLYKNPELLEMAINRHLIKKNKIALFAPPPMARDILRAYFSKWDIENIKSILSSKLLGYTLKESETFLVSFRDIPMGIFGGNLTHDDYKVLLSQDSIESMVSYLSRFGYGSYILQYMEDYRKTGDLSMLMSTLDAYFYINLIGSLKFYNGDEGPLIRYFREEIDVRNIMVILKAKDLDVSYDRIVRSLIPMGNFSLSNLEEINSSDGMEEVVQKIRDRYNLEDALASYKETGSISKFELDMKKAVYDKYIETLSSQALSIGSIFSLILKAERERENLRAVVIGKSYGLEDVKIKALLM